MNTKEEIFTKIKTFLEEEFEIEEEVTLESTFFEDLELDSLDAIDLMIMLDKTEGIKLKEEQAKSIRTIGNLVDMIYDIVQENKA